MGMSSKGIHKPEVLIRYEQVRAMGIPLVAGGLVDQPYLWLKEFAIITQIVQVFEAIAERNRMQKGVQ
jgi:hypothetical protein